MGRDRTPPGVGTHGGAITLCPCSSVVHWPSTWVHHEPRALLRCSMRPDAARTSLPAAGGVAAGAWPLAGVWPVLAGCWAARACCTACWIRACRSAGAWGTAAVEQRLPCGRGLALLAEEVKVGLPLPCLVEHILHPGHEVLHAAGQLRVADVPHVYRSSRSPTRSRRQQLAGASLTSQRSALGSCSWRVSSVAGGVAAGGASALGAAPRPWGLPAAVGLLAGAVAVEQGQCPTVELDGQRMRAELGPVRGVGAGALRRQAIGLLPALHAGGAIRVEGPAWARTSASALCRRSGRPRHGVSRTAARPPG